nr:MAG TPA: hypothetical protein [Caudoviricetes sp.]
MSVDRTCPIGSSDIQAGASISQPTQPVRTVPA